MGAVKKNLESLSAAYSIPAYPVTSPPPDKLFQLVLSLKHMGTDTDDKPFP